MLGVIAAGHFCKERGFTPTVCELASLLVQVTRHLWQTTKVKMLSTPAKFHYIFNLRDLSRIWEGILKVISETITEKHQLMALWKHECCRVISDRFVSEEDKEWFDAAMSRIAGEDLGDELREKVPEEPYFVDFLREPPEITGDEPEDADLEAPKIYELVCILSFLRGYLGYHLPFLVLQIPPLDDLRDRLETYMIQYNETIRGAGMDLVFFKDAMVHLMKVHMTILKCTLVQT